MNRNRIIGLMIIAFALGDMEACWRNNRMTKKIFRKQELEKSVLNAKVKTLIELVNDMQDDSVSEAEMNIKFANSREFIDLMERNL